MTTMNISLPDQMKDWIESRIDAGQYHNVSEYIRDLIRRDQADHEKALAFRAAIDYGRSSGDEQRPFKAVIRAAKASVQKSLA
jgi:antitoxin ParD1/3/4